MSTRVSKECDMRSDWHLLSFLCCKLVASPVLAQVLADIRLMIPGTDHSRRTIVNPGGYSVGNGLPMAIHQFLKGSRVTKISSEFYLAHPVLGDNIGAHFLLFFVLAICSWLHPKTSAFFLHGIIFANISGFYSKQFCCYYCRACQWVYVEDDEGFCQFLYTNFGPQASHRNTRPSCLELFLLRDTPQNNQYIHILSWCFFIRDICAISCLKLFLWRTPPRTLSYFGICFLHDWARQSRLVTKQEWLDINGKCPLTDIPGWSPWRTPAKKIFFQFRNFDQKVPTRFRVPRTVSMPPHIPAKEFSRMSCISPTWHWRRMWSHCAYWIGRMILPILLGVHGTADWMKCGKATVLGVSPKAIPWVKGPKESCLPVVFWSQIMASTRKYHRRCWMLVLPGICFFGFPPLPSNLRSGPKLIQICNLVSIHSSDQDHHTIWNRCVWTWQKLKQSE